MIQKIDNYFKLDTGNTSYLFEINRAGIAEHLYYGSYIETRDVDFLRQKREFEPGCTLLMQRDYPGFSLEDAMLEMSSYGKGDIREPLLEITHADGSITSDFRFASYAIDKEKKPLATLPASYDDMGEAEHLLITLQDSQYDLTLEMHYYVYAADNVITKTVKLINSSNETVKLSRLLSNQLDLPDTGYKVINFTGAWTREMQRNDTVLNAGKFVNSSYAGVSSNRANPFTMLAKTYTTEDHGECYGFNLVYSGNHYTSFEVNSFGKTRVVSGINPRSFCFVLTPGDEFEAPEAVMSFSEAGFNALSQNFHHFVKKHILRGYWKEKERPILLNSWEACYFSINEDRLVELAEKAAAVGIELLVMDDGWFGKRNDDTSSLGDWKVNPEKLPNGLKGLVDRVKATGVDFGIWVEPEMVSENSDLYREHSDWVMQIPGKPHTEGRNQRILDLSKREVQDYIIDSLSAIFDSADISYCKWDMNRIFSDYYSQGLEAERQGELMHRYQIGLYRCMRELTEKYPKILFEGCASGGNRYDLGILSYFPQIWTTDDTDAVMRSGIQTNVSYGYPLASFTCHVSDVPNHQTLRSTPLETRYNIACFGCLGYEFNLCNMSEEELWAVREQVTQYKRLRKLFQYGDFYRVRFDERVVQWCVISQDKQEAVGMFFQKLALPNNPTDCFKAKGLDAKKLYHFSNQFESEQAQQGEKENITLQNNFEQFSKSKQMEEKEDCTAYGSGLMHAGVMLRQAFAGTGFNTEMRMFRDFSSRLYHIKEVK
ncbi:MAG: alpha-galactosidase [Oscillospiraceae bacterium]|nr:alpha-galactosidase [Oscillospiraceae bacterium]